MATRISFSTTYPDRMGPLRGKFTRFPEKIIAGLDMEEWIKGGYRWDMREAGYNIQTSNIINVKHPKTTTIRKNYDYWKSKEGKMIQPFFWAGKPRRSKHVLFCPEVRLKRVRKVRVVKSTRGERYVNIEDHKWRSGYSVIRNESLDRFTQNEGFDHPDHFWMWFDKDFNGCLLEIQKQ